MPCPDALVAAARRARASAVSTADRMARIHAYEIAVKVVEQAIQEHTNARGYSTAVHDALAVVEARIKDAILSAIEEV